MKYRVLSKNRGYTLVEVIIVIAIMAVLSAMAAVTWRSVDSAKYKKSVSTFESELMTLRTSTMGQDSNMALKLYYEDGEYYIKRGYVDTAGVFHSLSAVATDDPNESIAPTGMEDLIKADYYKYSGVANPVSVMKRGTIEYNGMSIDTLGDVGVVVQYKKQDGSILTKMNDDGSTGSMGAGVFKFIRANGEVVANVHLNQDTGIYHETYGD